MKEYYEQKIATAQAALERMGKKVITCVLTYRVVEYTEGMDDRNLYTSGGGRSVQFIIRPKQWSSLKSYALRTSSCDGVRSFDCSGEY